MIEDINRLIKIHLNLLYEGHGNYTKYSDIIKRTCPEGKTDEKYFLYNTLVAFNSSSLLNVSWGEGGMRWSINKNYKENSNTGTEKKSRYCGD